MKAGRAQQRKALEQQLDPQLALDQSREGTSLGGEGPGLTDSALRVAGTCVRGCVCACMRVQGCLSLHFIRLILMTSKTHPSLDRKLGDLSLQHISEAHPRKGPAGPANWASRGSFLLTSQQMASCPSKAGVRGSNLSKPWLLLHRSPNSVRQPL